MIYLCEYCKKEYSNYEGCKKCEESHVAKEKIQNLGGKLQAILKEIQENNINIAYFIHHGDEHTGGCIGGLINQANNGGIAFTNVSYDLKANRLSINSYDSKYDNAE